MSQRLLYAKNGFSLVEIIVAAAIMATTIGGVFSVFIAADRFVQRASRRLNAVSAAQGEIENLRVEVRADTWGVAGNDLFPTGGFVGFASATTGTHPELTYTYRVDNDTHPTVPFTVPAAELCRRVYMRIQWAEPQ